MNADPDPGQHEKWIPYETYVHPQNDAGLDAVAQHEFDEYKLRRKGTKIPTGMGYPSLATLPGLATSQEISLNFEDQTLDLLKPIEKFLRAHVVRDSAGDAIHGPYVAGDPFPIVPLRVATLRKASKPESLLKPRTSAVVVPILKERTGHRLLPAVA